MEKRRAPPGHGTTSFERVAAPLLKKKMFGALEHAKTCALPGHQPGVVHVLFRFLVTLKDVFQEMRSQQGLHRLGLE